MKMKIRITILIVLTLLLGFALGMLTSAQLRHKRMRPVRTYASVKYFREILYKVAEPDSVQQAELDMIIEKYSEYFNDLNSEFRKDFETMMDEQWNEIKPVLNKNQIDKLEEFEQHRSEMMKEFRKRERSGDRDHFKSRPDHRRRPPEFMDSLANPPGQKTDSL
ncbi:MAG TPA: hypothetical protein DEQ09_01690 [Bacteroidales bacterium]|nr:hypothetical protein [Bacteroidales bacterium]